MRQLRRLPRLCLAASLISSKSTVFSFQSSRIHSMNVGASALRSRSRIVKDDRRQRQVVTAALTASGSQSIDRRINEKGIQNTVSIILDNLPFQRTHERILIAVYLLAGLAVSRGIQDKLVGQSIIALVWLSFSLSISFMEAWVKFKAPLLRKYVAVDVGRHVFCAQHAVELGLAIAFWIPGYVSGPAGAVYYPAVVGTGIYLFLSWFVGPLLYFRAKYKMVNGAVPEHLWTTEEIALAELSKEIQGKQLPSARWHVVYVLLDTIKILALGMFVKNCFMLRNS